MTKKQSVTLRDRIFVPAAYEIEVGRESRNSNTEAATKLMESHTKAELKTLEDRTHKLSGLSWAANPPSSLFGGHAELRHPFDSLLRSRVYYNMGGGGTLGGTDEFPNHFPITHIRILTPPHQFPIERSAGTIFQATALTSLGSMSARRVNDGTNRETIGDISAQAGLALDLFSPNLVLATITPTGVWEWSTFSANNVPGVVAHAGVVLTVFADGNVLIDQRAKVGFLSGVPILFGDPAIPGRGALTDLLATSDFGPYPFAPVSFTMGPGIWYQVMIWVWIVSHVYDRSGWPETIEYALEVACNVPALIT